jgi:hypothetical protein
VHRFNRFLLSLYPARVRSEFAGEMFDVFLQAATIDRSRGADAYLRFCTRKVVGLIVSLSLKERSIKHKRLIIHGGLAGLFLGGVIGAAWNSRPYTSAAVLRLAP